ncbi:MAG: hypothetical protein WC423_20120 [Vulcanimicrobiota bacterium]
MISHPIADPAEDDVQELYKEELDARKRRIIHVGVGPVQQSYNTRPGAARRLTREEILTTTLEEDRKRLHKQIVTELTEMTDPNKVKVTCGLLALGQWYSTSTLAAAIEELSGGKVPCKPGTIGAFFSGMRINKGRAFNKLLLSKPNPEGRGLMYSLVPSACKLHLTDLHQLSFQTGTYSLEDAFRKVPELKEEIKERKAPAPLAPPANPAPTKFNVVTMPIAETRVVVQVNFGPLRVVFGTE